MADVRHYADNFNYACVIPVNSEAFSDRIAGAKKRPRRTLVHPAADVCDGRIVVGRRRNVETCR